MNIVKHSLLAAVVLAVSGSAFATGPEGEVAGGNCSSMTFAKRGNGMACATIPAGCSVNAGYLNGGGQLVVAGNQACVVTGREEPNVPGLGPLPGNPAKYDTSTNTSTS